MTRTAAVPLAFGLAAAVLVADRVTTTLALHHVHGTQHVWGPFGLSLDYNSGFAFSLFAGRAAVVSVLLCIGVVILGGVVALVRTWPEAIGAGLVFGGAIGNISERLVSDGHPGQVPDFITLSHWPTFNVADAAVTVGVIVVAWSLLFGSRTQATTPAADARTSTPTKNPDPS
ncbi:MAG TPA: signal peptidase II [Acidimicrobiales bacterium]